MHWVFNLLLVIICSTLVTSLSDEEILKVQKFYTTNKTPIIIRIFREILKEYVTDPNEDIFEHYVYGRPNPCTHYSKVSDADYDYSTVEMKELYSVEKHPWMITLDDKTYFSVPVLLMCELYSVGILAGYFTLMLLDPELHTFLQVNEYLWTNVNNARAPMDIINAKHFELSYLDKGHRAMIFLNATREDEMKLFQYCDMLRMHDYKTSPACHVVKGGVKIQDYVFYLNKEKKVNVPGVVCCEIEYNENVTKVSKNIVPGTKEVRYYIPNRSIFSRPITDMNKSEFYKAKPLHIEIDGKEALTWY